MLKNKPNIIVDKLSTHRYCSSVMATKKPKAKASPMRPVTAIRFDSDEQKRKLEEVAKDRRQSLNQFMLTAAEAFLARQMENAS